MGCYIHLTSVLGVLGTQETSCILIAGLLERDTFDLFLPEFDKPWVIHLRKTCCCSTNLCTWRPNTIYKNRSVRRHQGTVHGGKAWRRLSNAHGVGGEHVEHGVDEDQTPSQREKQSTPSREVSVDFGNEESEGCKTQLVRQERKPQIRLGNPST
jgi:hypothetical protein